MPEATIPTFSAGALHRAISTVTLLIIAWLAGLLLLHAAQVSLHWVAGRLTRPAGQGLVEFVRQRELVLQAAFRALLTMVAAHFFGGLIVMILWPFLLALFGLNIYLRWHYFPVLALAALAYAVMTWTTLWGALRLNAVRREPGRPLRREEAPGLWAEADSVAARLGTRPVEAIYITPWCEVGVLQRGGALRALWGQEERCLIIGLGALRDLRVAELRTILAHELAHLIERDIVGGHLTWAVRERLDRARQALVGRGLAGRWHPAWSILQFYSGLFVRLTSALGRVRELLADRYAGLYGVETAIAAIDKLSRAEAWHVALVQVELAAARQESRPVRNLYALPAPPPGLEAEFWRLVEAARRQAAALPDAHPPLEERAAMLRRLAIQGREVGPDRAVWTLFADAAALQGEMTRVVAEVAATQRGLMLATPVHPSVRLNGLRRR